MPLVVKTTENSTEQLFNRAVLGVLNQGEPCVEEKTQTCHYRINDNETMLACAIGHIITDEVIEEHLNKTGIKLQGSIMGSHHVRRAIKDSIGREMTTREQGLFQALQGVHDTCGHGTKKDNVAGQAHAKMVNFSKGVVKLAKEEEIPLSSEVEMKLQLS